MSPLSELNREHHFSSGLRHKTGRGNINFTNNLVYLTWNALDNMEMAFGSDLKLYPQAIFNPTLKAFPRLKNYTKL